MKQKRTKVMCTFQGQTLAPLSTFNPSFSPFMDRQNQSKVLIFHFDQLQASNQ